MITSMQSVEDRRATCCVVGQDKRELLCWLLQQNLHRQNQQQKQKQ